MSDSFQVHAVRTVSAPFRLKKVLLNFPELLAVLVSRSSVQVPSLTTRYTYLLQIQQGSLSRQSSPNASNDQRQKRRSRATSPFLSPDRYRTDHHQRLSPSFLEAAATLPPPPKLQQSTSLTSRTNKYDNLHKSQENSSGDRADPVPEQQQPTSTSPPHISDSTL